MYVNRDLLEVVPAQLERAKLWEDDLGRVHAVIQDREVFELVLKQTQNPQMSQLGVVAMGTMRRGVPEPGLVAAVLVRWCGVGHREPAGDLVPARVQRGERRRVAADVAQGLELVPGDLEGLEDGGQAGQAAGHFGQLVVGEVERLDDAP